MLVQKYYVTQMLSVYWSIKDTSLISKTSFIKSYCKEFTDSGFYFRVSSKKISTIGNVIKHKSDDTVCQQISGQFQLMSAMKHDISLWCLAMLELTVFNHI